MDWKKFGYILASSYRKKIVLSLKEDAKTPKQISLELELHLSHVSSTLKDLTRMDIIKCLTLDLRKGKLYGLTGIGEEIVKKLEK